MTEIQGRNAFIIRETINILFDDYPFRMCISETFSNATVNVNCIVIN